MKSLDTEPACGETILASLIFLLTHYAWSGGPQLAMYVTRHIECVCVHPDIAPVVRNVCASLHAEWAERICHDAARAH